MIRAISALSSGEKRSIPGCGVVKICMSILFCLILSSRTSISKKSSVTGPAFGPHAQNNFLSLFVLFDPNVAFGGFQLLQVFFGIKMAVKIDIHGLLPDEDFSFQRERN